MSYGISPPPHPSPKDLGLDSTHKLEGSDRAKCPPKSIRDLGLSALRADKESVTIKGNQKPTYIVNGLKYFGCRPKSKIGPKSDIKPTTDTSLNMPTTSKDSKLKPKECIEELMNSTATPSMSKNIFKLKDASVKSDSSQMYSLNNENLESDQLADKEQELGLRNAKKK